MPAAELTERSVARFASERRKALVRADQTGAAHKALGLNNDVSASSDDAGSPAQASARHAGLVRDEKLEHGVAALNHLAAVIIVNRKVPAKVTTLTDGFLGATAASIDAYGKRVGSTARGFLRSIIWSSRERKIQARKCSKSLGNRASGASNSGEEEMRRRASI